MKGERAIEPASLLSASGRLPRVMKVELADSAGQVCHCKSSGLTDWPRPISAFATRTSTVCTCATGSAGGDLSAVPLARYAATPPAARAMARTTMRAVYIRNTTHRDDPNFPCRHDQA